MVGADNPAGPAWLPALPVLLLLLLLVPLFPPRLPPPPPLLGAEGGVGAGGWANSTPVYMIPLISTDMLILLLPLVLVRFAAESWRLSEAWLLIRMLIGSWAVMARKFCCSARCMSRCCSSATRAIFFSGGSPDSSFSRSCSRAAACAATAA